MLQLSHLKLLAGVVFALFILTACGGGDSAAPAAATPAADAGTGDGGNTGGGGGGAVTKVTCEADGKYWTGTACVPKVTSCTYANQAVNNICTVTEYGNNAVLSQINAKTAYDVNDSYAGFAGAGQTVSIYAQVNAVLNYDVSPNVFVPDEEDLKYDSSYAGLADTTNPVFIDGYVTEDGTNTSKAVAKLGDCGEETNANTCKNRAGSKQFTHHLNALAGRKDAADVATATGIHGIAYDANIKLIDYSIHLSTSQANTVAAIKQGGGANIAAMINTTVTQSGQTKIIDGTSRSYNQVNLNGINNVTYQAAWKDVVDNGTLGTIIITKTGENGSNSVNGMVKTYTAGGGKTSVQNRTNDINPTLLAAATIYGSLANSNRAAYSDDVTHADFDGKWLAVTGVDENNLILSKNNGCAAAAQYCLAVPELEMPANDGTAMLVSPDYILAGALAVIRSAHPTLTAKQTVALVLGTADYLDIKTKDADGKYTVVVADTDTTHGTIIDNNTGKYNPVYGHGLLNLGKATTLSTDDAEKATVVALSASPIGANWGDTNLTLSSHFGSNFDSVNLGVQDKYGRHFVLDAQNTTRAPVAVASLDEYMGNMLADNVQSERLGPQAQANYSNNADGQNWMNLEYVSGKATSKIAFQDNYKVKPLNDSGATSILRANHIRPASQNIGMMDVDYALNGNLSLSSYAARGEYDTGYKFDELGTDFDVNYKKSHLNIAIGNIREHDQFLGTHTTGGYALNTPTVSRFTDVTYGHDVGAKFNIYANYINYETDVDMLHDQFASIDNLQADQYQVGFTGKSLLSDDDNLNVALITKLGVTDGALNQNTTLGYTADGAFNDVSQSYDLAVSERHQQFEITYQGKIYQNADKVSTLKDNRFFTTIRVDQNLNHVQGASQTEIVSGVSARF